jgi:hypothetical protein
MYNDDGSLVEPYRSAIFDYLDERSKIGKPAVTPAVIMHDVEDIGNLVDEKSSLVTFDEVSIAVARTVASLRDENLGFYGNTRRVQIELDGKQIDAIRRCPDRFFEKKLEKLSFSVGNGDVEEEEWRNRNTLSLLNDSKYLGHS